MGKKLNLFSGGDFSNFNFLWLFCAALTRSLFTVMGTITLEERKTSAVKEIRDLLNWSLQEEIRITEELKAKGKFQSGLDGNSEEYALLNNEFKKRMKAIFTKYDLPSDTKLKLW